MSSSQNPFDGKDKKKPVPIEKNKKVQKSDETKKDERVLDSGQVENDEQATLSEKLEQFVKDEQREQPQQDTESNEDQQARKDKRVDEIQKNNPLNIEKSNVENIEEEKESKRSVVVTNIPLPLNCEEYPVCNEISNVIADYISKSNTSNVAHPIIGMICYQSGLQKELIISISGNKFDKTSELNKIKDLPEWKDKISSWEATVGKVRFVNTQQESLFEKAKNFFNYSKPRISRDSFPFAIITDEYPQKNHNSKVYYINKNAPNKIIYKVSDNSFQEFDVPINMKTQIKELIKEEAGTFPDSIINGIINKLNKDREPENHTNLYKCCEPKLAAELQLMYERTKSNITVIGEIFYKPEMGGTVSIDSCPECHKQAGDGIYNRIKNFILNFKKFLFNNKSQPTQSNPAISQQETHQGKQDITKKQPWSSIVQPSAVLSNSTQPKDQSQNSSQNSRERAQSTITEDTASSQPQPLQSNAAISQQETQQGKIGITKKQPGSSIVQPSAVLSNSTQPKDQSENSSQNSRERAQSTITEDTASSQPQSLPLNPVIPQPEAQQGRSSISKNPRSWSSIAQGPTVLPETIQSQGETNNEQKTSTNPRKTN